MKKHDKDSNESIKCNVESCKHNNCEEGTCALDEVEIDCTCNNCDCSKEDETICKSFEATEEVKNKEEER